MTTEAQEAFIRRAQAVLEADPRVAACWLEGSFAEGTADAWSDIDLHLAVDDGHWDGVFAERLGILARMGPVLAHGEAALPWGAHLLYASLAGPVRLDLYIERQGRLEAAVRLQKPRVLFDRSGVAASLRLTEDIDALIRMRLRELLRQFFFGAAWPVRLWGREEWGTLLMNAAAVIYQFLVPAMLIQDEPAQFFRAHYHNERFLRPERRRAVNAMLGQVLGAFHGIEEGRPDPGALAELHQRLLSQLWSELRAACHKYGTSYPEDAEREMREHYRRELGLEIPALA